MNRLKNTLIGNKSLLNSEFLCLFSLKLFHFILYLRTIVQVIILSKIFRNYVQRMLGVVELSVEQVVNLFQTRPHLVNCFIFFTSFQNFVKVIFVCIVDMIQIIIDIMKLGIFQLLITTTQFRHIEYLKVHVALILIDLLFILKCIQLISYSIRRLLLTHMQIIFITFLTKDWLHPQSRDSGIPFLASCSFSHSNLSHSFVLHSAFLLSKFQQF